MLSINVSKIISFIIYIAAHAVFSLILMIKAVANANHLQLEVYHNFSICQIFLIFLYKANAGIVQ